MARRYAVPTLFLLALAVPGISLISSWISTNSRSSQPDPAKKVPARMLPAVLDIDSMETIELKSKEYGEGIDTLDLDNHGNVYMFSFNFTKDTGTIIPIIQKFAPDGTLLRNVPVHPDIIECEEGQDRHLSRTANQGSNSQRVELDDHGQLIYPPDYPDLVKPQLKEPGRIEKDLGRLRSARMSGSVQLEFIVGSNGRARDIRVIRTSGFALLDQVAVKAVQFSQWKSGQLNGRPVSVWMKTMWEHSLASWSGPSGQQLLGILAYVIKQRAEQPPRKVYWGSQLEAQAQDQLTLARYYMTRGMWDQALEPLLELYATAEPFSQFNEVLSALGEVLMKLNKPELAEKIYQQLKNQPSPLAAVPTERPKPTPSQAEKDKPTLIDPRQQTADHETSVLKAEETKPTASKQRPSNVADPMLTLSSELVNVPVIARDSNGRYVGDLQKKEFTIYEDKVRQGIAFFAATEEPLAVALLLDNSLSTTDELPRIQEAAIGFVEQLGLKDQVLVVSFNEDIRVESPVTADREKLRAAVRATRSGSTTRLYDALMLSVVEHLSQLQGRRAMVLLTDGYDSASKIIGRDEVIKMVEEAGVPIYTIAYDTRKAMEQMVRQQSEKDDVSAKLLGMQRGYQLARKFLRQLEEVSGGRLYPANRLDDLPGTFAQIAQELRHLYSLGYYPSNDSADGRFHKIRVEVNRQGVKVHSRAGYYPHQP